MLGFISSTHKATTDQRDASAASAAAKKPPTTLDWMALNMSMGRVSTFQAEGDVVEEEEGEGTTVVVGLASASGTISVSPPRPSLEALLARTHVRSPPHEAAMAEMHAEVRRLQSKLHATQQVPPWLTCTCTCTCKHVTCHVHVYM